MFWLLCDFIFLAFVASAVFTVDFSDGVFILIL